MTLPGSCSAKVVTRTANHAVMLSASILVSGSGAPSLDPAPCSRGRGRHRDRPGSACRTAPDAAPVSIPQRVRRTRLSVRHDRGMPRFRVQQGENRVDVDALTVMEARAKAVVHGAFRNDETLLARPFSGDRPPSFTTARPAPAPALDAAVRRPRLSAQELPGGQRLVRPPSVLASLGALVALTALLFGVLAAGATGIVRSATRVGALGDCARIGLCVRTPLSTVEARTGVHLPHGVEVIRSSASRDGHYVGALVGLPVGADAPDLPEGMTTPVTRRAAAALRSASASNLEGRSAGPVGLFTGTTKDRTIVFLRYDASR